MGAVVSRTVTEKVADAPTFFAWSVGVQVTEVGPAEWEERPGRRQTGHERGVVEVVRRNRQRVRDGCSGRRGCLRDHVRGRSQRRCRAIDDPGVRPHGVRVRSGPGVDVYRPHVEGVDALREVDVLLLAFRWYRIRDAGREEHRVVEQALEGGDSLRAGLDERELGRRVGRPGGRLLHQHRLRRRRRRGRRSGNGGSDQGEGEESERACSSHGCTRRKAIASAINVATPISATSPRDEAIRYAMSARTRDRTTPEARK